MMADSRTQLTLLRHGHCEGAEIFRGSTDCALSLRGLDQMRSACQRAGAGWDLILSSPARRCHDFASELADELARPLRVDDGLRELHFGDWEGCPVADVWQRDELRLRAFHNNPLEHGPPNGETLHELAERVNQSLTALFRDHRDQSVLLVTHGGVIRVLLTLWLDMPLANAGRWEVPHACMSQLTLWHSAAGRHKTLVAHNILRNSNLHD